MKVSIDNLLRAMCVTALLALTACGQSEPVSTGGSPNIRRLTETQYRNIIADLFGPRIVVGGRFDPLVRTSGLLEVGARSAPVTATGLEEYDGLARSIAAQVVKPGNREYLLPCKPQSETAPDDACAKQFYGAIGRLLYRRPLTDDELKTTVSLANATSKKLGGFYDGLSSGLAALLEAPPFLFIVDSTEPDPDNKGGRRLTAYAKASRLSFLLWNTTPDDELLTAAASGDLDSKKGLKRQVDRMLASQHLNTGVRAFFSDMFGYDGFDSLEKDSVVYPKFSLAVAEDAKEQTLRTLVDLLVTQNGDYRDIFTTRKTFMSPALSRIYEVPVNRPDGGWSPYTFPEGDPRAGIATQIGFVSLYAHPGRSSSTLRGRAVREELLCQKVPDPPGNVSFDLFNDPNSPHKTARERLTAHASAPSCAGCHKIMDPIGLALEKFDGIGQFRTAENGEAIDTSGNLDGVKFEDAAGLGAALHDNPAATACVVNRLYSYAVGRVPNKGENEWVSVLQKNFAEDNYRFTALLRRIAMSDAFYAVSSQAASTRSAESNPASADIKKENKS